LVRLYWPRELRPAFDALFDIYDAMGDVVMRSTDPRLAAIKLAWWRERLDELDEGKIPAEPRLQAVAAHLVPRGISGAEMADLESGWANWLEVGPDQGAFFPEVGARLFKFAARLLAVDEDHAAIAAAGRIFAITDVARRGRLEVGPGRPSRTWAPREFRPLTAMAALAARDITRGGPPFETEGTPGRALALLRHRLTGRF
jgi:phytoene synthase